MIDDGELVLALLNTRPVNGGVEHDELADDGAARRWARTHGGTGKGPELRRLRRLRELLTDVVLQHRTQAVLAESLVAVRQRPVLDDDGLRWELVAEPDERLSARIVLAWAWVHEHLPGRLRPCGNDECQLFLLDRSKANRARWCSMAGCGNRMKARRHYERTRARPES